MVGKTGKTRRNSTLSQLVSAAIILILSKNWTFGTGCSLSLYGPVAFFFFRVHLSLFLSNLVVAGYLSEILIIVVHILKLWHSQMFILQSGPHILSQTGHLTANDVQWVSEFSCCRCFLSTKSASNHLQQITNLLSNGWHTFIFGVATSTTLSNIIFRRTSYVLFSIPHFHDGNYSLKSAYCHFTFFMINPSPQCIVMVSVWKISDKALSSHCHSCRIDLWLIRLHVLGLCP